MSKKAEIVGSHFPTIYLTVVSLLQGIALSQLVPDITTYLGIVPDPWSHAEILPLILMLLVIFIVWHHYAIGIFFLRWFPNIIDTIIPFLISIGQFYLITFLLVKTSLSDINVEGWNLGFAFFLMAGSVAYFAAAWRIDPTLFTNLMSLSNGIEHSRLIRKYFNWAGLSILAQGLLALVIYLLKEPAWLLLALILLLSHMIIFELIFIRTIKPHFIKSLDESEEDEKSS